MCRVRLSPRRRLVPCLSLALLLTACGGSSDDVTLTLPPLPPTTAVYTVSIPCAEMVSLDGNGNAYTPGQFGDDGPNDQMVMGVFRYDLSSIPAGSTFQSARLLLPLTSTVGMPETTLPNRRVSYGTMPASATVDVSVAFAGITQLSLASAQSLPPAGSPPTFVKYVSDGGAGGTEIQQVIASGGAEHLVFRAWASFNGSNTTNAYYIGGFWPPIMAPWPAAIEVTYEL